VGRFVVLGAGGMLGQQVARQARMAGLEVVTVSRNGNYSFRYQGGSLDFLGAELNLKPVDTLVNCVGWIPQKSSGDDAEDTHNAYLLNSELVAEISYLQRKLGFLWIQILTDCVFSGRSGGYDEESKRDATDLYGESKKQGERFLEGAIGIRASIVGPDENTQAGLYSWFKRESSLGHVVNGYTNARWNGVSTLAFSKLCVGIHGTRELNPGTFHWIPTDSVSKFELLCEFAANLGQTKPIVKPLKLAESVDRTLSSLNPEINEKLWRLAGYPEPLSIKQICYEFVREDIARR
jgi:dTDP-4-dehydrorhamnose reductase